MNTEEQLLDRQMTLIEQCTQAVALVVEANNRLLVLTQKIAEQEALILRLSQDNLKLVAKLDELTGRKAPGTDFSA